MWGGALYLSSSTVDIVDSTFENNTADDGSNNGQGGALYLANCDTNIAGSTLSDNYTTGHGGAIMVAGGTLDFSSSTLKDNEAGRRGGGISGYTDNSTTVITIDNATIKGNTAGQVGGGVGGLAYNGGDITIDIANSTISGNEAENGGGVGIHNYNSSPGLATVNVLDTNITGNQASQNGGGICAHEHQNTTINLDGNTKITDNSAPSGDGGGIFAADLSNLTVGQDVTFSGNAASTVCGLDPADLALYQAQVSTNNFSNNYVYGYNNADINYTSTLAPQVKPTSSGTKGSGTISVYQNPGRGGTTPSFMEESTSQESSTTTIDEGAAPLGQSPELVPEEGFNPNTGL